jgi:peptide/nickel transport system permease protein
MRAVNEFLGQDASPPEDGLMLQYATGRVVASIPLLLLVCLLAFSVVRLVPGDAVMLMLAEMGNASPQQLSEMRAELGVDRPFALQFMVWLGGAVRGDLGRSIWTGRPVGREILRTLPVTAELAFFSIAISLLVAIPIGIGSAIWRNSALDYASRLLAMVGLSVPEFALATVALLVLSLYVGWVPSLVWTSPWQAPWRNLGTVAVPSVILGFSLAAVTMRMTRSAMLEVLREDYVRTARSKGLPERGVVIRHALKNAFNPIVTIIGIQARRLIGSTVVIETIFALPGLGRLTVDSLLNRDFIQLQGCILVIALAVILLNLLVDLSYAWLDPRIHYR